MSEVSNFRRALLRVVNHSLFDDVELEDEDGREEYVMFVEGVVVQDEGVRNYLNDLADLDVVLNRLDQRANSWDDSVQAGVVHHCNRDGRLSARILVSTFLSARFVISP